MAKIASSGQIIGLTTLQWRPMDRPVLVSRSMTSDCSRTSDPTSSFTSKTSPTTRCGRLLYTLSPGRRWKIGFSCKSAGFGATGSRKIRTTRRRWNSSAIRSGSASSRYWNRKISWNSTCSTVPASSCAKWKFTPIPVWFNWITFNATDIPLLQ